MRLFGKAQVEQREFSFVSPVRYDAADPVALVAAVLSSLPPLLYTAVFTIMVARRELRTLWAGLGVLCAAFGRLLGAGSLLRVYEPSLSLVLRLAFIPSVLSPYTVCVRLCRPALPPRSPPLNSVPQRRSGHRVQKGSCDPTPR